jgi:chromosome segregation ATPase
MTRTELAVIEAKAALDRATEAQREEQRASWKKQLTDNRAQLRGARTEYQQLTQRIKSKREQVREIQVNINKTAAAISASFTARPEIFSYLPSDPECVAWQTRHTELEDLLASLISERDAATPDSQDILRAVSFEGGTGVLATLEYREQAILNALNGTLGTLPEGGVFSVF